MHRQQLLCRVQPCLLCTRRCRKNANQEALRCNKYDRSSAAHCWSYNNSSLSVSSNEQCKLGVHCAAAQETLPLNRRGKLQKRLVQIRRDGFIIRLKCQLLGKPIPRLHSQIDAFNFQLFLPNRSNHHAVKHSANMTKHTQATPIQLLACAKYPISE